MKKTKVLAIVAVAFLVLFCVITVALALLGAFSRNKTDPLSGARDAVLDVLGIEHDESGPLDWQKEPAGDAAVFVTDFGEFKVTLFPSEGTDAFLSLAESGRLDGEAFSVLAENLFAQVPPLDDSAAELSPSGLAALSGTLGFLLDENKNASTSLVLVTAEKLSGLSRAYLEENPGAFDEKRAALYEEKGGVPEYEDRLALFGQVTDGFDVLSVIVKEKTDGYTGGYHAENPVVIRDIRIEKAETESRKSD